MSNDKFKAAVRFVIEQCEDEPSKLGAIRLNKVLWYADMAAYKIYGKTMTGERYLKRAMGPVPATILATVEELVEDDLVTVLEPEFPFDVRKYLPKSRLESNLLSFEETRLLKSMIDMVSGYSANAISEETHDTLWESLNEGDEIPLFATLAAKKGPITHAIIDWAEKNIEQREKTAA